MAKINSELSYEETIHKVAELMMESYDYLKLYPDFHIIGDDLLILKRKMCKLL